MSLLLPLFVAVPLLASGLLVLVRAPRPVRRATLLATCAASAIAGFALLGVTVHRDVIVHRLGGWDASLAIPFAADTLSALMVALTSFTTLVTVLFAARVRVADEPYFCPLVLAVVAGVNGALLTADLFNLFVFIEIMLVPSYALIVLAHRGMGRRMQVTATRIYVTVNLLTSSVFLMGVALIYASLGTVNLGALAGRAFETPASTVGSCLLLLALAVKAAVVPMHGWLSRTYPFMSPTVSALFSGLHTKVAVYAIFRIYAVLFGADHRLQTVALVVFCVSMAIGVLGAVGEKNARAILSFHMVSQIGYILMGFALLTPAGVAAGLFYLVHNVIAKASLFLSTAAVEMTYGPHDLGAVRGLARREPVTAVVFFVAAMSLAGLPPFSGFVAKFAVIAASFEAGQGVVGAVALGVSLFTLLSMLKIWGGMFLGEDPLEDVEDAPRIHRGLIVPAGILAAASVALGLGAEPLLQLCLDAARDLLDPSAYAAGVMGR